MQCGYNNRTSAVEDVLERGSHGYDARSKSLVSYSASHVMGVFRIQIRHSQDGITSRSATIDSQMSEQQKFELPKLAYVSADIRAFLPVKRCIAKRINDFQQMGFSECSTQCSGCRLIFFIDVNSKAHVLIFL